MNPKKIFKQIDSFEKKLDDKKIQRLDFNAGGHYFNTEFVKKCVEEIKIKAMMGEQLAPVTNLERLAILLILDSVNINEEK